MPPQLSTILASLERSAVECERDRLREELADYEALLRLIDRHSAGSDVPDLAPVPAATNGHAEPSTAPNGDTANGHPNGGHVPLSRKREVVLAIMRERPGRWTTADLRRALTDRGIDPAAGTPVKNVLWRLAKAGAISAAGSGVYEFPALSTDPDDPRVQEAMGV